MSARMMRRVLRERESSDLVEKAENASESNDDEEAEAAVSSGYRNTFDLLGDQDDGEQDKDEDDVQAEPTVSTSSSKPQASSKGKKKKKGKKKGKSQVDVEEEALEKLMQELAIQNGSGSADKKKQSAVGDKSLAVISVDPKHLRAEDELRRIFGSKVINAVERSGEGAGLAGLRRRQPGVRNAGRVSLRKTYLVVPLEHWPRWDGGVSMEVKDTKDGISYFRYVYSPSYLEIQKKYEACVASHDPNTIAMLLGKHTYHIDSLLALAEVYKHVGEYQQSAMLLEKCLYALESAWHPWFNPMSGKCRLDFSCEENKPFFFALFRHMQHLGRRGCHRTALEVCKLLLSIEPEDPFGARFCIDYYALRAEQYEWLESFVDNYYKDRSIALLPNFSFSLAIARFYLEQNEAKEEAVVPSSDLLQQALMLHPLVLSKIVERAPVKEDATWTKLLKHPHFAKATAGGPTLEHLINIYIERNYLIWRAPDLQSWLKAAALAVVDSVNRKDAGEAANWACARAEAFQAEHNEYQHLMVSEFSDSTSTLPPEELQHFAGQIPGQIPDVGLGAAGAAGIAGAAGAGDVIDLRDRNALLVFLESIIPWINYGNVEGFYEAEDEQPEDEQQL